MAAAAALTLPICALAQVAPVPPPVVDNPDSINGKEPAEGVYVRDSATAAEKKTLAIKMERLKEWNKSADLYQEVIVKYADRVVPSQVNKDNTICQYTSISNSVQERLAKWPQEGLDIYRARYETPAQTLLDSGPNDIATLNKVYSIYFITEAGKQAGIRLIDLYLETGEYPAAAWLGDRLLTLHPGLITERSSVLYRTALAHYYAGDVPKAKERFEQLKANFPNDRGIIRGKDVLLADSLAQEIQATVANSQSASADSWPMPFGDPSRSRVSAAEGRPGARLYGIPLSTPAWPSTPANMKEMLKTQYDESIAGGETLGILPVVDRGELFFQDGQRLYAVSIDSGVPLSGWAQTYASGAYTLPSTWGSPRGHQLSVSLTDHEVLAIMGQPDLAARTNAVQGGSETRMVCLDRQDGKEKWVIALSQLPESAKEARALQLSGSPLVIGDSVLVIGRGVKNQFEDCYVLAFDLPTGKFRWATYIASASTGAGPNFAGMGGPTVDPDNPAHLAYANGRVYVQTCLGALAALDAYTGAIAWLDIYPTGRQPMERLQNQFVQGNGGVAAIRKPWIFNPVIVQDGIVFTLPTINEEHSNTTGENTSRFLLIYDAATGVEIQRIDLKDAERKINAPENHPRYTDFDTLLGVVGDDVVISGDNCVICLNWKKYSRETFNPRGSKDQITRWFEWYNTPIHGRGFVTKDSVYIPLEKPSHDSAADVAAPVRPMWRLSRLSMAVGKELGPVSDRRTGVADWEQPEGPGNVLATSDYVIVAGAKSLNVYTDLIRAKTKLDHELAAAPEDPKPRLRYAEIMFVSGDPDVAIARLDEAAELMGGLKAMRADTSRDRFFRDSLTFADRLSRTGADEDRQRAVKLFDRAGASAFTPIQQVAYRRSRAQFAERTKDFTAALSLYQEILADAKMRSVPMAADDGNTSAQADAVVARAIASILKNHPAAYESFEQAAAAALETARAAQDDPGGKLLEVARMYPNSTVAGKAMIAAAQSYESAGDPHHAIAVLRDMWFRHPESPDKAGMLEAVARNYLVMAAAPRRSPVDLGPMENMEAAAASLARATALGGDGKLEKPLKLRDGKIIPAGTPFSEALTQVRNYRGEAAARALPDLNVAPYHPPLRKHPKPQPFLAADPAHDIVPNIKSLVLPLQNFARSDRVAAWTMDGVLDIFAAGEVKPLATSKAVADEPRSCAWVGDQLLVWNGGQLVNLKSATGDPAWKLDIGVMQAIDVIHIGDNPPAANANIDPNIVAWNRGMRVGVGQRVAVRFRPGVIVNPQPAAAAAPAGAEEIIDVRPVGDHVLVTTSTGRILSADLASGQVSWQTRLSDRPVDRLVANEDFTVVKVSDESYVRLAAFDTVTGELRCTKAWSVPGGQVPVNLALAADGTLVYTMPNQLCLKDLYKPWGDPSDKDIPGTKPELRIFDRANQPDQLVIAEGRILAFAVEGTMNVKFVRIYSLETGQPVLLHYRTAQGEQEAENRLDAGKTDEATLHVIGSHLYIVSHAGVMSYNLDRPSESWQGEPESIDGRHPAVHDHLFGQKFVVLVNEPLRPEDGGVPPVPLGGIAPVAPNGAIAQPEGVAGPIHDYHLELFARYPASAQNPREAGRLDYNIKVSDPAGITPSWQAANGGLYYVSTDHKLHFLRGRPPGK
jgi:outer membrane protein assembly factor BamB